MEAAAEGAANRSPALTFHPLTGRLDLAALAALPVREIERMLDANPTIRDQIGDLAGQARASFARALAKDDAALKYAVGRTAKAIRAEVAGAAPTPLELLLADRIATTWLELHVLDVFVAQEVKPGVGRLDPEALEALDRRRGRAHKRYLAAIHELALVRRLLVPSVRVHIDQRQRAAARAPTRAPERPALPGRITP